MPQSLSEYLNWLIDRDHKSPGLKLLQGRIWEQGYDDGELRGEVFADVPPAFARWRDAGLTIAIYSSGSVLAQRLLFAHSDQGDLTPWIARYFDTEMGPKRAPESYARIASSLDLAPGEIAFVSDVDAELEAAHDAGCHVVMCVRPGNAARVSQIAPVVESFDAIDAALRLAAAALLNSKRPSARNQQPTASCGPAAKPFVSVYSMTRLLPPLFAITPHRQE